jgi:hypothetical protein
VSAWRLEVDSVPMLSLAAPELLAVTGWACGSDGAAPTLTVALDGARVSVTRLDPPPLRAAARLFDGADCVFTGCVQAVRLGETPSLTLET